MESNGRAAARFVGRASERDALLRALGAARKGSRCLVVVEGEPGTGKTTLVDFAIRSAPDLGFRVLAGASSALDGQAFEPMLRAFEVRRERTTPDGPEHVRPLFPAPSTVTPPIGPAARALSPSQRIAQLANDHNVDSSSVLLAAVPALRSQMIDLFVEMLEEQLIASPVLLVLEDLHWADASSLLSLHSIVRRLHGYPLVALATARTSVQSVDPVWGRIRAMADTSLLLDCFGPEEIDEVVSSFFSSGIGPRLRRLVALTGGNPFQLVELLTSASAATLSTDAGGRRDVATDDIPEHFAARIDDQVRTLSPTAREVVSAASVVGQRSTRAVLSAVLGLPVNRVDIAVTEAERVGLLTTTPADIAFRHDLTRHAVESTLSSVLRTALHRETARVLIDTGGAPTEIVAHLELGGRAETTNRGLLVQWLVTAGHDALFRSPGTAMRLLGRARQLTSPDDPSWLRILAMEVEGAVGTGQFAAGEDAARQLLASDPDAATAARARLWLGCALFLTHRSGEAADMFELAAHGVSEDDRPMLLAYAAVARITAFDTRSGQAVERAIEAAERSDRTDALALAQFTQSRLLAQKLDLVGQFRAGEQAIRIAMEDQSSVMLRNQPHFFAGLAYLDDDQLDAAREVALIGRNLAEVHETVWAEALFLGQGALIAMFQGRTADAEADARAGVDSFRETGSAVVVLWCFAILVMTASSKGDFDAADDWLAEADAVVASGQGQVGLDLLELARALSLERRGDVEAAEKHLLGTWQVFGALGAFLSQSVIVFDLARLARVIGDTATLIEVETSAGGWARSDPSRRLAALRDAVVGTARADSDLLDAASASFDVLGRRWEAASTRALATQILRGRGIERNATPAESATEAPAASGWAALTEGERRVAELVARPLSNRAIAELLNLSSRTVETHVSRTLAKLGISSRLELALIVNAQSGYRRAHRPPSAR